MKTDLASLLAKLTESRREMVYLMTLDRRGGVNALPFDAEAIAGVGRAICAVEDRVSSLEFGDHRTSEEATRSVSLYR